MDIDGKAVTLKLGATGWWATVQQGRTLVSFWGKTRAAALHSVRVWLRGERA